MKRYLFLLIAVLVAVPASAQVLDSSLLHRSIFELLSATGPNNNRVVLVQPEALHQAVQQQILQNTSKRTQGFRIRIFSSNLQTARSASLAVLEEFQRQYPHIPAYLDHRDIDFRVTVGDFRTKSEAERLKRVLTTQYRSAIVIREAIAYPAL